MNNNNQFVDPLERLLSKHQEAMGIEPSSPSTENEDTTSPTTQTDETKPTEEITSELDPFWEIDYGDTDIEEEIAREEEMETEAKMKAIENSSKKEDVVMPPNEYDMKYHEEAINYQSDKLAVVTTMVNKVVAKHHLISGGIDPVGFPDRGIKSQRQVMGELIDIYHENGDVITPEFENMILDNWVMPDGITATESIKANGKINNNVSDSDVNRSKTNEENTEQTESKEEVPVININVPQNAPVSVTVDESIIPKTYVSKEINIHVKEISERDIDASKIIENCAQDDIIKPYDSGIGDMPITLPMSAYRCVMRPINWYDSLQLTTPTSNNPVDIEMKKWSIIYNHMKNISIGSFENFDDFLKKTKYQDGDLLMWAILVASSDETEEIHLECRREKCNTEYNYSYSPRSLIHINEELVPKHYQKTHDVAVGAEAIDHWKKNAMMRIEYTLPDSGYIVEINDPSAYEYLTNKLPTIREIFKRFKPEEEFNDVNFNDPSMMLFDYLSGHAMLISAITIPGKDGKRYRYTDWDKMEEIITSGLGKNDSTYLLGLITSARQKIVSPMSFYLENVECPNCHSISKRINIPRIADQLVFQLSRGLQNTTINLIEMD